MKGHVPTPPSVANKMVSKLFDKHPPRENSRILYPGVGDGPFVQAVQNYCQENSLPTPQGVAIEMNPELLEKAQDENPDAPVEFLEGDFLALDENDVGVFDYIIGNPPYVPIERLSEEGKQKYRTQFQTAEQRFDLYILFFEQSLRLLDHDGRLVFIAPEKFEYTHTTAELRRLMKSHHVEQIEHVSEDTFTGKITYPTITTIHNRDEDETEIVRRDSSSKNVELPSDGSSWASYVRSGDTDGYTYDSGVTLKDATERISCGVATGRDKIFVKSEEEVPDQLVEEGWVYPTTSGRQLTLNDGPDSDSVIICPYDENGRLVPEDGLGSYGDWAELHRDELESRSCVEGGKAWYSWHENPPMKDIYGVKKIVCRDVCESPEFWVDRDGDVIPRHSVYYIVPHNSVDIDDLQEYLNSPKAAAWIEENAQKAANDYYRMQSRVLKELPIPEEFGDTKQTKLV